MRAKGKIRSWNDGNGYGFISPMSGGKDVFVHIKAFGNRSRRPETGQVVTYDEASDKQGRACAANATLAGDRLQQNKKKSAVLLPIVIAVIFLVIVALSVLGNKLPSVILAVYIGLSILTFLMYAVDKSAARKGTWRTQESTLHLLALAGGWPGALIAQQQLRHKSRKEEFQFMFWVTILLNCGMFVWLFSAKGSSLLNSLL